MYKSIRVGKNEYCMDSKLIKKVYVSYQYQWCTFVSLVSTNDKKIKKKTNLHIIFYIFLYYYIPTILVRIYTRLTGYLQLIKTRTVNAFNISNYNFVIHIYNLIAATTLQAARRNTEMYNLKNKIKRVN